MTRIPKVDDLLAQARSVQKEYQNALENLEKSRRRAMHVKAEIGKVMARTMSLEITLECKRIDNLMNQVMGL